MRTGCTQALLPLLLGLTLPAAVQAQFNYTNINGTITVTGYTGPRGSVTIPATLNGLPVTRIGDVAFLKCTNLASVTIPTNVISIGGAAFLLCTNLAAITVEAPNSAYTSEDGVLFDKAQTTLIQFPAAKAGAYTVPNSVTSIETGAFNSCANLTGVTMGSRVTNIGGFAFTGCANLSNVTIPDSITSIGFCVFSGCSRLTSVTIPESITNLDDLAFCGCGRLTSVRIPESVTAIGCQAFGRCGGLTNVAIGNNVTNVGPYAFCECIRLSNVRIPNGVTSIGDFAFSGCTSLANVTIPNNVTSIGDFAFSGCTSLTNVTIPGSLTNIGFESIACFFSPCTWVTNRARAFDACPSLKTITVDVANPSFSGVAGVLFNKSQTVLVECPQGEAGSYTIPNSVSSVGACAFSGCAGLTTVTIPNGVTNLEGRAFAGCSNLTSVYFEGNAPTVEPSAFESDRATAYYLPGTVGWGPSLAGLPTAPWMPQVQIGGPAFGVGTNQFGFTINWAGGLTVVVEASASLANPVWFSLATNTLSGGSCYFRDPQWRDSPARFYRLRWP